MAEAWTKVFIMHCYFTNQSSEDLICISTATTNFYFLRPCNPRLWQRTDTATAEMARPSFCFGGAQIIRLRKSRVGRLSMQGWCGSPIYAMLKYCLAVLTLLWKRLAETREAALPRVFVCVSNYPGFFCKIKLCWAVTFVWKWPAQSSRDKAQGKRCHC